ncbi:hypothetical protein IGI04_042786 [Brassica rapa subsp. trilocularis]|uniref:AB hydrolase-1 domain-containing protein n=1 Tax=Brassica rapa subsp. trilocularis TaxID=1813537 RepID=A0ABQ7KIG5_BRACM|nr:hypothetical protein IGI04_042786 [Brassica rapa subsp. trilocularis]
MDKVGARLIYPALGQAVKPYALVGVITTLSPRFSKLFTSSCFKMDSGMKMKVAVVFKGNNYLVWSRMVKTAVGSKGLWGHITSGTAPKPSLVAYMGAPNSRNNDQDFIRKADIDALIRMFKDNGNIYGYSYGASMIARTVGDLDCITRTDTTPTSDHGGERSEPETTQESSGASGTHDQDVEAKPPSDAEGLERIRPFMDKVGARLIYPALGQAVKPYACVTF